MVPLWVPICLESHSCSYHDAGGLSSLWHWRPGTSLGSCWSSVHVRRLRKLGADVREGWEGWEDGGYRVDTLTRKKCWQPGNSRTPFTSDLIISGLPPEAAALSGALGQGVPSLVSPSLNFVKFLIACCEKSSKVEASRTKNNQCTLLPHILPLLVCFYILNIYYWYTV